MKITILSQEYAPEEVSNSILVQELAEDLVNRGHAVTVVTCAPNYPLGKIFPGYSNAFYKEQTLKGVRVIRVWSYISPNKKFWDRILDFGTFSAAAFYGGLLSGRPDVLVSYSPPLPLGISAYLLSRIWRSPWVMRLQDLFPEAAVASGVLKNATAIRFFDWLATFLYKKTSHISLITNGFHRILVSKGISPAKLSVTPVWADPDIVHPEPKENVFRRQHGLENKFVVMYAGIIGITSSLEDVMQAALLLKSDEDIRFIIIGEGVKKEWVAEFIENNQLRNVELLPFQDRKIFSEMMAAADVNLTTLNAALSEYCLPHKVFNIMASSRPILLVAPPSSDVARLVIENQCGVNVPPGSAPKLVETIQQLKNNPQWLVELGINGRELLLSEYSRKKCMDQYEETFTRTIK